MHPGIRDSFGHYIPGRDDGSPEPVPRGAVHPPLVRMAELAYVR